LHKPASKDGLEMTFTTCQGELMPERAMT